MLLIILNPIKSGDPSPASDDMPTPMYANSVVSALKYVGYITHLKFTFDHETVFIVLSVINLYALADDMPLVFINKELAVFVIEPLPLTVSFKVTSAGIYEKYVLSEL